MNKNQIKEFLNENQLTPEILTQELKITGNARVYEWINENCLPNFSHLIQLADYFKCSIDYLLCLTEDNSETKFKKSTKN